MPDACPSGRSAPVNRGAREQTVRSPRDTFPLVAEGGPGPGRPLVDRLEGSQVHNLKELRPGSAGRSEIRLLFVFDPWRSAILLVGGDKSGNWSAWYRQAIPRAEELCVEYVEEREAEEGQQ
ncbi:type II toxin-antitoxin system RelE/ParE family toxin [Streptomyces sp. ST2-7A]|uniref:type II toxin-antitoxin system RelE/ParE family toxin n=1 Tax=Streptomyces sp. ST2-7A TaxID=2907214 RepID=UPI0035ABAB44